MKKLLFLALLFLTQTGHSKDYTLVVRGNGHQSKGYTEVGVEPGTISDTLVATPGAGVTYLVATIRDAQHHVLQQHFLPAIDGASTSIVFPEQENATLEISDDNEVVYEE